MHTLIVGMTESGKSTLARYFARRALAAGHPVIVRDPTLHTETAGGGWCDPDSAAQLAFDGKLKIFGDGDAELDRFYRACETTPGAHVFFDEAGDVLTVGNVEDQWILRRGRHAPYLLSVYLISQRPKMIAPNARTQCAALYLFKMNTSDRREILADFGSDDVADPPQEAGNFVMLRAAASEVRRGNVFDIVK
jgi:hypothetical protein